MYISVIYLPISRITTPELLTMRDPMVTSLDEKNYYHPNYGYEPYWANGGWMIRNPVKDLGPNETTPKIPLVCGEECIYIYVP
jgi:hypothetical protein